MCNINALKCTCTCIDALLVPMHINLYRNLLQRKACITTYAYSILCLKYLKISPYSS